MTGGGRVLQELVVSSEGSVVVSTDGLATGLVREGMAGEAGAVVLEDV